MEVQNIKLNYTNYQRNPAFQAASDITIKYVAEKHAKYVPERVLQRINFYLSSGKESLPSLREVHDEVYRPLMESTTLEQAKKIYPELSDVVDVSQHESNRSVAIKAIKAKMSLKDFTLDYLKKIYGLFSQEQLVTEYNFTNRSLIAWLNDKLHIKGFKSPYVKLLAMSDEKENARIAECSRQAIYRNPELQAKRQEKAAAHHRTQEYREKKRQEMKNFYIRKPEAARKTSYISQKTWDNCPEIKEAMIVYTQSRDPYTRQVLSKKRAGCKLSEKEHRIAYGFYKGFWEAYPELKQLYRERRMQVIETMNKLSK